MTNLSRPFLVIKVSKVPSKDHPEVNDTETTRKSHGQPKLIQPPEIITPAKRYDLQTTTRLVTSSSERQESKVANQK